jgi:hypothetical protein
VSNCWFVAQDAEGVAKWSDYLFMTSIQFLVQQEMVEIAPRSGGCMHLPRCIAHDVRRAEQLRAVKRLQQLDVE